MAILQKLLLILVSLFSFICSASNVSPCSLEFARDEAIGDQNGLSLCTDVLDSLPHAQRHHRDGPIEMSSGEKCQIQWFLPSEACSLLSKPKPTM